MEAFLTKHFNHSFSDEEREAILRDFPSQTVRHSLPSLVLRNLSEKSQPLRDKGNQWVWDEPQKKSFEQIKRELTDFSPIEPKLRDSSVCRCILLSFSQMKNSRLSTRTDSSSKFLELKRGSLWSVRM